VFLLLVESVTKIKEGFGLLRFLCDPDATKTHSFCCVGLPASGRLACYSQVRVIARTHFRINSSNHFRRENRQARLHRRSIRVSSLVETVGTPLTQISHSDFHAIFTQTLQISGNAVLVEAQ